LKISKE